MEVARTVAMVVILTEDTEVLMEEAEDMEVLTVVMEVVMEVVLMVEDMEVLILDTAHTDLDMEDTVVVVMETSMEVNMEIDNLEWVLLNSKDTSETCWTLARVKSRGSAKWRKESLCFPVC